MQSDCKETLIDNIQQTKRNKTTTKRRKMTVYDHRRAKGYKDKQTDCKEMQNNQKTDKMRYKKGHKMSQKMRGSCAK